MSIHRVSSRGFAAERFESVENVARTQLREEPRRDAAVVALPSKLRPRIDRFPVGIVGRNGVDGLRGGRFGSGEAADIALARASAKEIKVDDSVTDVVLRLDGSTNVTFESSDDTFAVEDLAYEGVDRDPVSIKRQGQKVVLEQDKGDGHNVTISYRLIVPRGRRIRIRAGLVNMSGSLDAKEFWARSGLMTANMELGVDGNVTIKAGSGTFNMTFKKCGKLSISGGSIIGNISVPKGTPVARLKDWWPLQIREATGD